MALEILDTAQCRNCRYSLRGLTANRCPECGQQFDPEDPSSMMLPGQPSASSLALLKPFGKSVNVVAVVGTIIITICGIPGYGFIIFIGQLLWIFVAARWAARLLLRLLVAEIYHLPLKDLPGGWRRFLVAPLLLTMLSLFVYSQIALYPGFYLHYPALRYVAAHVPPHGVTRSVTTGFFHFDFVSDIDAGIRFHIGDGRNSSLLYATPGYKPVEDMYQFHSLGGRWYFLTDPDHPGGILTLRGLFTLGGQIGD